MTKQIDTQDLKAIVTQWLIEEQMTQYWLAKEANIAESTLSRYLSGGGTLNESSIRAIMKVLNLEYRQKEE